MADWRPLFRLFDGILAHIVAASSIPSITIRTKCLKAIAEIVTLSVDVLGMVRQNGLSASPL
jgi:hypothetical protein